MIREKSKKGILQNCRGFSLLEVLLGISVFMIGMLGVTALNISSLKSNTFSGNLSEATLLAAAKIEELMAADFDDIVDPDLDGTDQDTNDDGIDNDGGNFGLDDPRAGADGEDPFLGKKDMYTVYWNVAVSEPITVTPARTKTINVFVEWQVKDETRRINMSVIRMKEE